MGGLRWAACISRVSSILIVCSRWQRSQSLRICFVHFNATRTIDLASAGVVDCVPQAAGPLEVPSGPLQQLYNFLPQDAGALASETEQILSQLRGMQEQVCTLGLGTRATSNYVILSSVALEGAGSAFSGSTLQAHLHSFLALLPQS